MAKGERGGWGSRSVPCTYSPRQARGDRSGEKRAPQPTHTHTLLCVCVYLLLVPRDKRVVIARERRAPPPTASGLSDPNCSENYYTRGGSSHVPKQVCCKFRRKSDRRSSKS